MRERSGVKYVVWELIWQNPEDTEGLYFAQRAFVFCAFVSAFPQSVEVTVAIDTFYIFTLAKFKYGLCCFIGFDMFHIISAVCF